MAKIAITITKLPTFKVETLYVLTRGTVFIRQGTIERDPCPHMVIEPIYINGREYNAVSLRSGCYIRVPHDEEVILCDAALTVKPQYQS